MCKLIFCFLLHSWNDKCVNKIVDKINVLHLYKMVYVQNINNNNHSLDSISARFTNPPSRDMFVAILLASILDVL